MGACGRTGPGPSCTQTSRHCDTTLACATGMPGFTLLSWAPSQGSSTATAGPVTLYCSRRQWVRPGRSKNTGRSAVSAVRVRDKSTIGGFASDGHGTQKMHL